MLAKRDVNYGVIGGRSTSTMEPGRLLGLLPGDEESCVRNSTSLPLRENRSLFDDERSLPLPFAASASALRRSRIISLYLYLYTHIHIHIHTHTYHGVSNEANSLQLRMVYSGTGGKVPGENE
jgi:hypothetical protein